MPVVINQKEVKMKIFGLVFSVMLMASSVFAGGFDAYGGIGFTAQERNYFDNPLGIVGVSYTKGSGEVYAEHISSIPTGGDRGLNFLGFNIHKKVSEFDFYGGLAIHSKSFDSAWEESDYGNDFNTIIPKVGVSYKYFYAEILEDTAIVGLKMKFSDFVKLMD